MLSLWPSESGGPERILRQDWPGPGTGPGTRPGRSGTLRAEGRPQPWRAGAPWVAGGTAHAALPPPIPRTAPRRTTPARDDRPAARAACRTAHCWRHRGPCPGKRPHAETSGSGTGAGKEQGRQGAPEGARSPCGTDARRPAPLIRPGGARQALLHPFAPGPPRLRQHAIPPRRQRDGVTAGRRPNGRGSTRSTSLPRPCPQSRQAPPAGNSRRSSKQPTV